MISILMAIKTGAQYFADAYASVVAQEHVDWELIVGVNGLGPRSDSWKSIRSQAPTIVVMDLPECRNKPSALNCMVSKARGSHIAILDVDDLWHPWKLALQLPYLREYDVVGTMGEYFGNTSGPIGVPTGPVTFANLLEKNCILNSSVILRQEYARWPDTDELDDYPLWLELAWMGKKIMNVGGEPLVKIRCHQEQHFAKRDNSHDIRERYKQLSSA